MTEPLQVLIQRTLDGLRRLGPGSHQHLDEALGPVAPPIGDPAWSGIARLVAEQALTGRGRFLVAVPLGTSHELPLELSLAGIDALDEEEPPAVHHLPENDLTRTWTGEHYRRDLPEVSSERLLAYISAVRDLDGVADEDPYRWYLHFEARPPNA